MNETTEKIFTLVLIVTLIFDNDFQSIKGIPSLVFCAVYKIHFVCLLVLVTSFKIVV